MNDCPAHGSILGGTVTTPDLALALTDYRDRLGLTLVERGTLPADLAESWGAPGSAGAAYALLQPTSGAPCHLRLVQQPGHPNFRPTTSFGWAAFELTVQDVFGWPDRLEGSGFRVVGPPRQIASMPFFVPMQVLGRGDEMLYLNEVALDMPTTDLPRAQSPVDHIFIVILAAPDRAASVRWYVEALGLDEADTHTIEYTMINKAFDAPPGTQTSLTMIQKGRMPIVEVDDYPAMAMPRPAHTDMLPPGNALITLAVDNLDAVCAEFITPPVLRDGPFYGHRRVATTRGVAGELVELVEIASGGR